MNISFKLFQFLIISFLISNIGFSQTCPVSSINAQAGTGASTTICRGNCATLTASVVVASKSTTSYSVAANTYAPYTYTMGTLTSVNVDDVWSPVINIGFSFCYFGNSFTQLYMGSNGEITFNVPPVSESYTISTVLPNLIEHPGNTICGPYRDIDPSIGVGSDLTYTTIGVAPCRIFVANWSNVPLFSTPCNSLITTFQIVLYERSNMIDVNIQNSPSCIDFNNGFGLIGIQNGSGTVAVFPPSRNVLTPWSASNESWRFTPTGPPTYSASWIGPNGYTSTGLSATTCPTTTSTYTATLNETNCDGSTTSFTSAVQVIVSPGPTITASSSSASICAGSSVTLTGFGGTTYTWNPGGLAGTSIAVSPSSTTIFTVTGSSGSCANTGTVSVTVLSNPLITATSSPSVICLGNSSTLTGSGASSYTWNPGGLVGSSIFVTPLVTTDYSLTGTSAQGCINTAVKMISVVANPNILLNSGSICSGNSFTIIPSGASTYTYSSGTNLVSPATNTSYTVTGANAQGCNNAAVTTISVNSTPTISVNSGSICSGDSFTLVPSGAITYSYSSGSNVVSPITTTSYTVTGSSAQGCTSTAISSLSVNATPIISVNNGSICSGNSFTIIPSGASTYTYSLGTNVVSPTTISSYTVTGASIAGCTNTAVTTISVNATPTISVNSGFICSGNSFTMIPSGASTYSYSSGTNVVSPATNTTYTVTGSTVEGCTNTAIITISVNLTPTVSVNSGSICSSDSFTLVPSGALTYMYSSGSNVVSPMANTTYTVTGSSGAGCVNTAVTTISVNAVPVVSVNTGSMCSSKSFTLIPSGAVTYTYSSGTNVVSPIANTSYTVIGSSVEGCTSTAVTTVSVNATPTISVNSGSICSGNSFTITPSGASSYSYSAGTNVVSPATNASYTITGANIVGCTNTAVTTISVNPTPTISVNSGSICSGNSFTLIPSGASTYTFSSGSNVVSPMTSATYTVLGASVAGCLAFKTSTVLVNLTPTISVNSGIICSGNSFTLSPSGASAYTYSSGSSVNSPTATTNYTVTGTSTVGCISKAIPTVSVIPLPPLSVNSSTICAGQSALLTATGAVNYIWNTLALTNTLTVSPLATSSYTVLGAANGCTITAISNVMVIPLPIVTINSTTICAGVTATLSATGASNYLWSTGASTNPLLIAPASTTNYTVVGTANGCTNVAVSNVLVNPLPIVTVNSQTICVGETSTLTALGALNYAWNIGAFTSSLTVSPLANTQYTVVGLTNGCSSFAVSTVSVNPLPILSINTSTICTGQFASLNASGASTYTWSNGVNGNVINVNPITSTSYSVVGTTNNCSSTITTAVTVFASPLINFKSDVYYGCDSLCVNFTDLTTVSTASIASWNWNFGNGVSSSIQNPYYCYLDTGYYDVTLTITTTQGCAATFIKPRMISIFPSPIASFTFDPSTADVLNPTVDFTNQSTNAATYQWSFGDLSNSSQTDPSHAYLTDGVYTVTLIATSNYGCIDITTNTLTVNQVFTFYAPNAFTPDEDLFNNVFKPIGRGWDPTNYELLIFDKWGKICFTSTDVTVGWDGRANNGEEVAQIGTYTWKVKLAEATGKKHYYIGNLLLLK